MKKIKNCKALFIGKKFIDYIKSFHTEYINPLDCHYVFYINQKGLEGSINYNPEKEQIEVL